MSERRVWGPRLGRFALFALAAVHAVLPFTLSGPYGESRIVAAIFILAVSFLYLGAVAHRTPVQAFWGGFGLLAVGVVVGAWSGASPVEEGLWAKLAFLISLPFAALTAGEAEAERRTRAE